MTATNPADNTRTQRSFPSLLIKVHAHTHSLVIMSVLQWLDKAKRHRPIDTFWPLCIVWLLLVKVHKGYALECSSIKTVCVHPCVGPNELWRQHVDLVKMLQIEVIHICAVGESSTNSEEIPLFRNNLHQADVNWKEILFIADCSSLNIYMVVFDTDSVSIMVVRWWLICLHMYLKKDKNRGWMEGWSHPTFTSSYPTFTFSCIGFSQQVWRLIQWLPQRHTRMSRSNVAQTIKY